MKYFLITAALMGVVFCVSAQRLVIDNDNDNFRFFYDIGVEVGAFRPISNTNYLQGGAMFAITGSYFYSHRFGFRSGLSLIDAMEEGGIYWRVPILFAFRTKTFRTDLTDWRARRMSHNPYWESPYWELSFIQRLANDVGSFLLVLLPTRFELNAGTSFGAIPSYHSERIEVSQRFANTLDANARLSFQFWRICINGNLGISYLLTRNINYTGFSGEETKPSWFSNMGLGVTFRF